MRTTWEQAVREIKAEMEEAVWECWFPPLRYLDAQGDTICVEVPNRYFGDYFEENFKSAICRKLTDLTGRPTDLSITVSGNGRNQLEGEEEVAKVSGYQLSLKQTFGSFVVGESNKFAHAACQNVASKPGENFNPLFIFGGVGVGKTHLLNAIGNAIVAHQPSSRVLYLSAEQFLNDMVNSLRHQRMERFHARYRQRCDVLLVDDIHFLSGKK